MSTTKTGTKSAAELLRDLLALPERRPGCWEARHVEALEEPLRAILNLLDPPSRHDPFVSHDELNVERPFLANCGCLGRDDQPAWCGPWPTLADAFRGMIRHLRSHGLDVEPIMDKLPVFTATLTAGELRVAYAEAMDREGL